MQLVTTTPLAFPAESNTWDAVRYWVGTSARFAQASLACQVMAGFALRELHAASKIKPGNPNPETGRGNQLPNDSVIDHGGKSWPEIVKAEAGISDDTARNWMAMADKLKSKWKKLPIKDRLSALMTVAPSQWQETDAKLISDAVHKATDGRTQLEFMWELGIAKKPQGSGARGRKPGEGGRPRDLDIEGEDDDGLLNEFRCDMRLFTCDLDDTLRKLSPSALSKHREEAVSYLARIDQVLKARKAAAAKPASKI